MKQHDLKIETNHDEFDSSLATPLPERSATILAFPARKTREDASSTAQNSPKAPLIALGDYREWAENRKYRHLPPQASKLFYQYWTWMPLWRAQ